MPIPGLDHWLNTPLGEYVLRWARTRCDQAVADVFGFNAIQLGLPNHSLLGANRMPLRISVAQGGNAELQAELTQLPLESQSIDLVVVPFGLDFDADPHQVLREIERVLRPEGQLVIIGFNPWSLWGLRCALQVWLQRLFQRELSFPWNGHYLSIPRLRDWLQLMGFEVERGAFGCYVPPCQSAKWLHRYAFLELAGDRWWGFAGGIYLLRAVKRVSGVRLLNPWRTPAPKAALSPSLPRVLRKNPQEETEQHVRYPH